MRRVTNAHHKEHTMLIRTHDNGFNHPVPSEITPRAVHAGRRDVMKLLAGGAAGAAGSAG